MSKKFLVFLFLTFNFIPFTTLAFTGPGSNQPPNGTGNFYKFTNAMRTNVAGGIIVPNGGLSVGVLTSSTLGTIAATSLTGALPAAYVSAGTFGSLSTKGNYTFQASSGATPILFIDATNQRVGVGTASPQRTLHISSSTASVRLDDTDFTNSAIRIYGAGNALGSNTTFQIDNFGSTNGGPILVGAADNSAVPAISLYGISEVAPTSRPSILLSGVKGNGSDVQSLASTDLLLQVENAGSGGIGSGAKVMTILGNGYLGLNSSTPAYPLSVSGTIAITGSGSGLIFPDGTTQTSAATSGASSQWTTNGSNIYYSAGNVGFGTTTPQFSIKSTGQIHADTTGGNSNLNSSVYDLAAANIGAQTYYAYGTICAGNGSHDCSGAGGVTLSNGGLVGTPDIAINKTGNSYFNVSGGKLGVGTNAPGYTLDVFGDSGISGNLTMTALAPTITFNTPSAVADIQGNASGNLTLGTNLNTSMFLKTNNTTRMTVTGAGNVGIASSSPGSLLTVHKNLVTGSPTSMVMVKSVGPSSGSDIIYGVQSQLSGYGTSYGFVGSGDSAGVYGSPVGGGNYGELGTAGYGVHGYGGNSSNVGVYGYSEGTDGVYGYSNDSDGPVNGGGSGVHGNAPSGGTAVYAEGGYLQFSKTSAGAPTSSHCDSDGERGRFVIDTTNNRLYICNGATRGWDYVSLTN